MRALARLDRRRHPARRAERRHRGRRRAVAPECKVALAARSLPARDVEARCVQKHGPRPVERARGRRRGEKACGAKRRVERPCDVETGDVEAIGSEARVPESSHQRAVVRLDGEPSDDGLRREAEVGDEDPRRGKRRVRNAAGSEARHARRPGGLIQVQRRPPHQDRPGVRVEREGRDLLEGPAVLGKRRRYLARGAEGGIRRAGRSVVGCSFRRGVERRRIGIPEGSVAEQAPGRVRRAGVLVARRCVGRRVATEGGAVIAGRKASSPASGTLVASFAAASLEETPSPRSRRSRAIDERRRPEWDRRWRSPSTRRPLQARRQGAMDGCPKIYGSPGPRSKKPVPCHCDTIRHLPEIGLDNTREWAAASREGGLFDHGAKLGYCLGFGRTVGGGAWPCRAAAAAAAAMEPAAAKTAVVTRAEGAASGSTSSEARAAPEARRARPPRRADRAPVAARTDRRAGPRRTAATRAAMRRPTRRKPRQKRRPARLAPRCIRAWRLRAGCKPTTPTRRIT